MTLLDACSISDGVPETGGAPQITLEEALRLGDESAGDTLLFASINQIAVNSRGDFIIFEQRPLAVCAFRTDGTFQSDVGSQGAAPGEYRWVRNVVTGPADSVYVWDSLLKRVLIYDPHDFSFVRQATVDNDRAKQFTDLIGVAGAGWLIVAGLRDFMPTDESSMEANPDNYHEVRRVSPDGSYGPEIVATQRADEMILSVQEGGGSTSSTYPLHGPAFGEWGRMVCFTSGGATPSGLP